MSKHIVFLIFFFLSLIATPQEVSHAIVLETQTGNIHGTLLTPKIQGKVPLVIIIAGSGATDRNGNNPMMKNNSLRMLAEGLHQNNIASLRYDKRGIAESKNAGISEEDLKIENYIADVNSWIGILIKDKRFSEIIILGHSEGSLIGMVAAQSNDISKFISIAGAGESAGRIIRRQLKDQPQIILDQSLPIIKKLENGETEDNVPQMLYSLFRPSVQPYMISWFKYDPKTEVKKLDKPVLIIQGDTDIQVSMKDADLLAMSNPKSTKIIIEGMNHIMKESEVDRIKNFQTYSLPNLPIMEELIKKLSEFIN